MRPAWSLSSIGVVLLLSGHAFARCGDRPGDATAVTAARAQVASDCSCADATSHRAYVGCAAGVAGYRIGVGTLPRACRAAATRCAVQSTCGRPGWVTCCRTRGVTTRCGVQRAAARCTPPRGGSACVGSFASCCEACASAGCATSNTTSTTTTTTTTTTPPPCVQAGYPSCGGTCDAGRVCQSVRILDGGSLDTRLCLCVDPARSCFPQPPGTCTEAGVCPPGFACTGFIAGSTLECGCCDAVSGICGG